MGLFKDRTITKFDWFIIGSVLFLLVLATLGYLAVQSMLQGKITELRAQIEVKEKEVAEARAVAARKEALIVELAQVREKIARFEEKLPTDKEVPKLLNQFQQIAELSGLKYELITAEPIDEKELYMRIPFKVKVEGTYPIIGEFLRSLEFGNRFIKVEDIDIGPQDKGSSEANFIISTYMFVNKQPTSESGVTQS